MEILINDNQLEISRDFALEMEETNPFFSEVGAQSLPVKLPFSPKNLAALDYPERIARYSKLKTEYDAVIRSGAWQKNGKLIIFSADKVDGINATFYINNGEFYTKLKDVKMSDITFYNNPDPFTGTYSEKATQWLEYFEQVQAGTVTDDYEIFPVATKIIRSDTNSANDNYEYINEPDTDSNTTPYKLVGYSERMVADVMCPVGYGVSPFLKLNFLLEMLFAHFGYSLQESLFDTDVDMAKIVVPNNCKDSICAGKLNYSNLVPTVTVEEFLETISNKFCCIFVPDGRNKTVKVHFFETPESLNHDMDITPFVVDSHVITHDAFKQLKLSAATSIESAKPATETFERIIYENDFVYPVNETQFLTRTNIMANEVVLRLATGTYYKQVSQSSVFSLTEIGSQFFNYDKKTPELEYDERETRDEQVPMFVKSVNSPRNPSWRFYLPGIGEGRNLNTGIKKDTIVSEEKEGDCKIMLCFYLGVQSNKCVMGSPFNYDGEGNKVGDFSLQYAGNALQNGLFQKFWKSYDALLRHAFRTITCKLNMPISDFFKFSIFTPKLLDGTPVMPVSIKYNISDKGLRISEVEFKTLRLQKPYDLAAEQSIPLFNTSDYYWKRFDNLTYWHDYAFDNYGPDVHVEIVTRPPDPRTYPAPTQAEFNSGNRYHEEQYQGRIVKPHNPGIGGQGGGATLLDFDYNTWVIAFLR